MSNRRARRTALNALKALTSQMNSLSDIDEPDFDSGLEESSEEESVTPFSETPATKLQGTTSAMKAYNKELDKNIEIIEKEIIRQCDHLIGCVERRRNALLLMLQDIRSEKVRSLHKEQDEHGNGEINLFNKGFIKNDSNLGSCLRFVTDDKLSSMIDNYGTIDEGRAAAKNSEAHGIGLKYGIANEPTQFELETYNISEMLSWVEQDKIEVLILKGKKSYPCVVQNKCTGYYSIFYELQDPGQYDIHVLVNGHHIAQSPFKCDIYEKCDLKFLDIEDTPEWTFQNGDKSALVEKTEIQRTSKLYSNIHPPAKAWKVRVTTACPKIKLRFGYSDISSHIPDLQEEYYCKFNLNELITHNQQVPLHHTYQQHNRRHRSVKGPERKQSTFHRSSLTFIIFQDTSEHIIHTAVEGTQHTKKTNFIDNGGTLVPFIGIKHFCKNTSCPRPMLVFV